MHLLKHVGVEHLHGRTKIQNKKKQCKYNCICVWYFFFLLFKGVQFQLLILICLVIVPGRRWWVVFKDCFSVMQQACCIIADFHESPASAQMRLCLFANFKVNIIDFLFYTLTCLLFKHS